MPTDLTGTPTSLGIGTYNTSADAPSGLGFNEAMAQIDALLADRVAAPSGISAGEVPVWDGSQWVRSSATRINNGGNALPKFTTGAFSAGPPASPADGDIWVATFVYGGRNYRWQFQYDGVTASSNKWVFVGGAPAGFSTGSAYSNSIAGTYQVPGSFPISPRTGDYVVAMNAVIQNATGGAIEAALAPALNGAQAGSIADLGGIPNGTFATLSLITSLSVVAGQVLDAAYYVSSVAGTHPWTNRSFFVTPTAVA